MAAEIYRYARTITPGTPVQPGRGVLIACSVAGVLNLRMEFDSVLPVQCAVGTMVLDGIAVKDVVATGSTATATASVLA